MQKKGMIMLVLLAWTMTLTGLTFAQLRVHEETPVAEKLSSMLRDPNSDVFVTVINEEGKPIEGAVLVYSELQGAPRFTSNANGVIQIDRNKIASTSLEFASFWLTAPGYGSVYHNFVDSSNQGYGNFS